MTALHLRATRARDEAQDWTRFQLHRMAMCILDNAESVRAIQHAVAVGDDCGGAQLWLELTNDERIALWVAPSKGGIFTTQERAVIRSWTEKLAAADAPQHPQEVSA